MSKQSNQKYRKEKERELEIKTDNNANRNSSDNDATDQEINEHAEPDSPADYPDEF